MKSYYVEQIAVLFFGLGDKILGQAMFFLFCFVWVFFNQSYLLSYCLVFDIELYASGVSIFIIIFYDRIVWWKRKMSQSEQYSDVRKQRCTQFELISLLFWPRLWLEKIQSLLLSMGIWPKDCLSLCSHHFPWSFLSDIKAHFQSPRCHLHYTSLGSGSCLPRCCE